MRGSLALFIGLRYHNAKHSNGFISFISKSSTLGIMLGVAVLIIGLSVMNGFEHELTHRFLGVISHGELEAVEQPLNDAKLHTQLAQSSPAVIAAAPYISVSALVQQGKKMQPVLLRGIDPVRQLAVTDLSPYISSRAWQQLEAGEKGIILGASIANNLGVEAGDRVVLLLPSQNSGKLSSPQRVSVRVLGLLNVGGQLDGQLAFMALPQAQALMNWGEGVTGISLRVEQPLLAGVATRQVAEHFHQLVYVKNWTQTYGYLYQDIQMVRTIMYIIMLLIVAVSSFNIVSTLVLAVSEKRGDLAILKTMGARNSVLIGSFVVYGAYNALLGCLLGAIVGVAGSLSLGSAVRGIEALLGHSLLSSDIYFINFMPVELHGLDIFLVVTAAATLSLLATLWPAWKASKVQPAQELGG